MARDKDEAAPTALSAATDCYISPAVIVGGYGTFGDHELHFGDWVSIRFTGDEMRIRQDKHPDQPVTSIPFVAVHAIEVSGAQSAGGGLIGGGFGLQGAATGFALASALSMITATNGISTIVHIDTGYGELFLHTTLVGAGALRMALSPAIWRLSERRRQAAR